MADSVLRARNLNKTYFGRVDTPVLHDVSLEVFRGGFTALIGPSGSGKSTLLHCLGLLDPPTSGEIEFDGRLIRERNVNELAEFRNRNIGFVFQFHYLMPELTVRENVAAPGLVRAFRKRQALERASALLAEVGLGDRLDAMPHQLSGGERQRAAIARSLLNGPRLLLADEPTGSLDWKTGEAVFALLRRLIADRGLSAVVATHNPQLARLTDRRYLLHGGQLEEISDK